MILQVAMPRHTPAAAGWHITPPDDAYMMPLLLRHYAMPCRCHALLTPHACCTADAAAAIVITLLIC